MSITNELREYAGNFYLFRYKDVREKLDSIADRIDEAHFNALVERSEIGVQAVLSDPEQYGLTVLPKDADGVPIRIGDAMVLQHEVKEKPYVVQSLRWDGEDWYFGCDEGLFNACGWEHYHEPTVEDLLREFADEYAAYEGVGPAGLRGVGEELMAKYSSRLRLVGDGRSSNGHH